MTYLLARANRHVLEVVAWSNVLLAFDFDGTLAPLVNAPERALIRASTRRWLGRAGRLYPCVVISGRARRDVLGRLRGMPIDRVVGNHGAEPSPGSQALRRKVRQWLPHLKARLSNRRGVTIEDKGSSIAVHYRRARARKATRQAILAAATSLDAVRIVSGTLVVNLVVVGAPDKGLALERERVRFGCDTVIFVGDDETDEDVFRLDRPGQLLSIRVGRSSASAASYYIRNQAEIDTLLERLIVLRTPSP